MTSYRMSDGTLVRTENASQCWEEERDYDGNNMVSRNTGTQHTHQTLYRSRKGRYYIEHTSAWAGSKPSAEWISNEEATRWLIHNEHELPDELKPLEEEVTE